MCAMGFFQALYSHYNSVFSVEIMKVLIWRKIEGGGEEKETWREGWRKRMNMHCHVGACCWVEDGSHREMFVAGQVNNM